MRRRASETTLGGELVDGRERLSGGARRDALVAAAASLLAEAGLSAVSMEAVALRAGVSRPLVYKHFANRDELLAELFRREAAQLDAAIVAAVEQAAGLEGKVRALVGAVLTAVSTHEVIFTPLLRAGVGDADFRREQRARDRRTVRFFARLATAELDLDEAQATAATAVLLTGIESVRAQWRAEPTASRRRFLEDLYVDLVLGGLGRVAARGRRADG